MESDQMKRRPTSDDIILSWTQECVNLYKRSGMTHPPAHEMDVMRNIFVTAAKPLGHILLPRLMNEYKRIFLENNRPILMIGFDPIMTLFALMTNVHNPVDILELPTYEFPPEFELDAAKAADRGIPITTPDKVIPNVFGRFTPQRRALYDHIRKQFPIEVLQSVNFEKYGLIYVSGTYFFTQMNEDAGAKFLSGLRPQKNRTRMIITGIENADVFKLIKQWETSADFDKYWRKRDFNTQIMFEPGQYLYENVPITQEDAKADLANFMQSKMFKFFANSESERRLPKRKTMMVTLAAGKTYYNSVLPGINSKLEYCNRHGYNFLLGGDEFADRSRPLPWSKIKMLEYVITHIDELCNDTGAGIPEWLFVSDADVVITNPGIQLDHIISRYLDANPDVWMILVRDLYGNINNGNMWLRICSHSLEFLRQVWNQTEFIHHRWWENAAMIHLISQPFWSKNVIIETNHRLFNAYVNINADMSKQVLTPKQQSELWRPGDFLVHLAGKYQNLAKIMERILADNLSEAIVAKYIESNHEN